MRALEFYFKSFLILVEVAITCFLSGLFALLRWGSLDINHHAAQFVGLPMRWLAGWKVKVENEGILYSCQPCIYVANHQSSMDVGTIGPVCPTQTVVIGKKEIKLIPFFNLIFFAGGNVMIDRKNRTQAVAGLSEVLESIKSRRASVFIFPEGTRNTRGGLLPFKKGAFHMAISAQVPVVPVVCSPVQGLIDPPKKVFKSGSVTIRVLPPVSTVGLTTNDVEALSTKVRDQMLDTLKALSN